MPKWAGRFGPGAGVRGEHSGAVVGSGTSIAPVTIEMRAALHTHVHFTAEVSLRAVDTPQRPRFAIDVLVLAAVDRGHTESAYAPAGFRPR